MTTPEPASDNGAHDALWQSFVDPPDEARPRVWWHWMDGNIDPAGIRRDLEWLHSVGVRGVQLFDGGLGGPLVVPHAVRPGSDEWDQAVRAAVTTAAELGLEVAVATSAGWSASGGPWVRPEDAMKKVVWSESTVEGAVALDVALPPLPDVAGRYQDNARAADGPRYATDWRVLAFPADGAHVVLQPDVVDASAAIADWSCLIDGSFDRPVALPRDPDGWSTAWIAQSFDESVTVESVVVGLPGPVGFGAAPPAVAVLQVSDDGAQYRDVAELPVTSAPARTVGFPPVTGRRFRLMLSGGSAAEALPPVSDGVRLPPVLRRVSAFEVSEFALRRAGRVHHAQAKAGFTVVDDYYSAAGAAAATGSIDPNAVVDLTVRVRDGVLLWEAPPGRWTILRLGASLTGQTNGPAPADATGLEVDKLDGRRVAAYLEEYLRRFGDAATAEGSEGIRALLSDSIESGPQNWTDDVLHHFARRRGYDATRWLPALAGYVVGDAAASDRFLYDYRRTIADLLAEQYYGTLAAEAHRRGMRYYAEALEDKRPQLGDDLAMRSPADVPMGAMWTFDPATGPQPTYIADLKGAASVAHVYGKRWTGSEAFTSFQQPWSWTPQRLKHIADLQLALGVTRFCIHTSPHQPIAAPPPGIALAPFLGQAFTINETWSDMAGPWIDYLARCSALLSAGHPAVDIAVFIGEEAPVTGLFGAAFDESVPPGFDFDYVSSDALADVLRVDVDGLLRSDGASYRLLYLGGSSSRMTLGALRHVERLLDAGATVVGERPEGSPSLADDGREVAGVCDRIWGQRHRGRVIATSNLHDAFTELDLRPALEVEGPPVRQIARIVDGSRVTFLANPSAEPVELSVTLDADWLPLAMWDPVALDEHAVRVKVCGDRGKATVSLPSFGSVFLLADRDAAPPRQEIELPIEVGLWRLDLPGRASTDMVDGPRLWTDLDAGARGHSGAGTYRATVSAPDAAATDRVLLDLGDVRDIARVRLNGVDCGVAWTAPFRVDVTAALRPGTNELKVQVVTPWRNRLIAEAAAPTGEISAPMTQVYEPTAEPLPAGLAGPVRLWRRRP